MIVFADTQEPVKEELQDHPRLVALTYNRTVEILEETDDEN